MPQGDDRFPRQAGAGYDWRFDSGDTEDTLRFQARDEPHPRIVVDPHSPAILVGDGSAPPEPIVGGTVGLATPQVTLVPAVFGKDGTLIEGEGVQKFTVKGSPIVVEVNVQLGTAPAGRSVIYDVNRNGTTIFTDQSHRPEVAVSSFSASVEAPNIDVVQLADGDLLTVDADQVGLAGSEGSDADVIVWLAYTSQGSTAPGDYALPPGGIDGNYLRKLGVIDGVAEWALFPALGSSASVTDVLDVLVHALEWRDVHGIKDTSALVYNDDPRLDSTTFTDEIDTVATDLADHEIATSGVHGIPDATMIVLTDDPRLGTIPSAAGGVSYDNTTSGLVADDVQAAVDEVEDQIQSLLGPDLSVFRRVLPGLGLWLSPDNCTAVDNALTQILNRLYVYRYTFAVAVDLETLGVNVATTVASSNVRVGVYADSGGLPGALVAEVGVLDTHTSTGAKTVSASPLPLSLAAGRYWLASVSQGAAAKCTGTNVTNVGASSSFNVNNPQRSTWFRDSVSGALPDPFGTPAGADFTGAGVFAQIV